MKQRRQVKRGQKDLAESQGCHSKSLGNMLDSKQLDISPQWIYLEGLRTLTCVCAHKFSPLERLPHSELLPWEDVKVPLPKALFIASSSAFHHPRKIRCQKTSLCLCVIYKKDV